MARALAEGTSFAAVCAALAPLAAAPAARAIELLIRWLDAGALTCPEDSP